MEKQSQSSGSSLAVRPQFACVTLNMTDRLRLISFPDNVKNIIRDAIRISWPKGIQAEQNYYGAYEFKLSGRPWYGQGSDSVPARMLMTAVFSSLYHAGWVLYICTDISKKLQDKDSMFFRSGSIPSPCSFFSVSFNEGDKIRLIGAPPYAINAVKQALSSTIQREQWKLQDIAYEFKMHGYPFYAGGSDSVTIRVLLLNILDALAAYGWEVHASLDMSTGPSSNNNSAGGSDTDSWFFRRLNN